MISLISFEKALVILKKQAEELGLVFKSRPEVRIGYSLSNKQNEEMYNYHYYLDELEEREDNEYYTKNGEKVPSFYHFTRIPDEDKYVVIAKDNHLVDLDIFAVKCPFRFYINKTVKTQEPSISNIQAILSQVEEKALMVNEAIKAIKDNTFNQKCNVHVGSGLITTYNDLKLKENICTDVLQVELNNGWRIIAVCVQPDQRRPDYILGRYNPQLEVAEKQSAER